MSKEATSGGIPAPQDALVPVHTAETDAAWADKTDLHIDDEKPAAAPAAAATQPEEETEGDVITDKPGLTDAAQAVAEEPAAAPGEDGKPVEAKPDEKPAEEVPPASDQEQLASYWKRVGEVFPAAFKETQTEQFLAWFEGLPPNEQAEAADPKNPEAAVRVMGKYYEDRAAGRIKAPVQSAPKVFNSEDVVKGFAGADIKLTVMVAGNPVEKTVGAIIAEYGEFGAASLLAQQAGRDPLVAEINRLRQELGQIRGSLQSRELDAKEAGASAVANSQAFQEFKSKSKLMSKAWAQGSAEDRLEILGLFRAANAKVTVDGAAEAQRKARDKKANLQYGTIRGQPARPGPAKKPEDMTPEELQQAEEAAWADKVGTE